ncbi:MAG TPA: hypothetical protein VFP09_09470 [Desertimonas sp.]|nr:hypothetical protein [Desertimonas sp.]
MFPTGSRLLIGATLLTAVVATIYGVTNGGSLGTTGLISAAAGLAVLTAINLYTRDADVSAMDTAALTESAAAHRAPWPSLWPAVGALGATLVVIGLVTYPAIFVLGVVALIAATVEWMLQAWSERASGDATYNREVRERFAHAAEFPVLAALGFGVIVYSFSRIMLTLSKEGGPAVFGTIAALVLAAGFLVAFRRNLDTKVVGGIAVVALIALAAGGFAAALSGERELHPHETMEDVAAAGECGVEETEADENASQSVSAKASLFAEILLDNDGQLVATDLGLPGETTTLTFQRTNPTNVLFINESDEERRLVLEYAVASDGDPPSVAAQQCTALVDEDGSQFLTFSIDLPSEVYGPFRFVVPGVEDQAIEVIVP